jgi:hypothetical protein
MTFSGKPGAAHLLVSSKDRFLATISGSKSWTHWFYRFSLKPHRLIQNHAAANGNR